MQPQQRKNSLYSMDNIALLGAAAASTARQIVPAPFICPITLLPMVDPVKLADGHSFERTAITAWLARSDINPSTGEVLEHKRLTPNLALVRAICEWSEENDPVSEWDPDMQVTI